MWILALIVSLFCIQSAQAASFSRGGSSFSSSRSFSAPASRPYSPPAVPRYTPPPPRPVAVQKTTVVQQNVTHVQQGSSGGGFFSNMAASFAGAGIANWLFAPKPQPAPAPQAVDCSLEQNKQLQICQPAK
jgi:hypothetical protein